MTPLRNRRYCKIALAAALLLGSLASSPAGAVQGKGSMELGLSAYYVMPQQDLDQFDPNLGYGLMYQYWFTRMSSLTVGLHTSQIESDFTLDGHDEKLTLTVTMLDLGVRYRPEVDLWTRPYIELGVGYEFWATRPSPGIIDPRNGSSLAYYLGVGAEQEVAPDLSAGINVRYYYFPLQENFEDTAITLASGEASVEKYPVRDSGLLSAGLELTWQFK